MNENKKTKLKVTKKNTFKKDDKNNKTKNIRTTPTLVQLYVYSLYRSMCCV